MQGYPRYYNSPAFSRQMYIHLYWTFCLNTVIIFMVIFLHVAYFGDVRYKELCIYSWIITNSGIINRIVKWVVCICRVVCWFSWTVWGWFLRGNIGIILWVQRVTKWIKTMIIIWFLTGFRGFIAWHVNFRWISQALYTFIIIIWNWKEAARIGSGSGSSARSFTRARL